MCGLPSCPIPYWSLLPARSTWMCGRNPNRATSTPCCFRALRYIKILHYNLHCNTFVLLRRRGGTHNRVGRFYCSTPCNVTFAFTNSHHGLVPISSNDSLLWQKLFSNETGSRYCEICLRSDRFLKQICFHSQPLLLRTIRNSTGTATNCTTANGDRPSVWTMVMATSTCTRPWVSRCRIISSMRNGYIECICY